MIEEQAIRVEVSMAKLAGRGILDVLQLAVQSLQSGHYGQQTMQQLNRQGQQLASIDISDRTARSVKRQLKQYAVDFAITKEKDTGKMYLWFKGQDVDRVQAGIKNCIADLAKEKPEQQAELKTVCEKAAEKTAGANRGRKNQYPEIGERT